MPLSRDQILDQDDLPSELVYVPAWKDSVWVRGLSGSERDLYERGFVSADGKAAVNKVTDMRASLVVKCLVDEHGNRLFADKEAAAVGRKSAQALDVLFEAAQRLSGLSQEDAAELEGKSAAALDGSTSGSQPTSA